MPSLNVTDSNAKTLCTLQSKRFFTAFLAHSNHNGPYSGTAKGIRTKTTESELLSRQCLTLPVVVLRTTVPRCLVPH